MHMYVSINSLLCTFYMYVCIGFGFVELDSEDDVDRFCEMQYITINGKKVLIYIHTYVHM